MGLGGYAFGQCQLHGGENSLFIVMQHEGEDIDHLSIAARCPAAHASMREGGLAQHVVLQLSERRR